jgi:hypothetical protein
MALSRGEARRMAPARAGLREQRGRRTGTGRPKPPSTRFTEAHKRRIDGEWMAIRERSGLRDNQRVAAFHHNIFEDRELLAALK